MRIIKKIIKIIFSAILTISILLYILINLDCKLQMRTLNGLEL